MAQIRTYQSQVQPQIARQPEVPQAGFSDSAGLQNLGQGLKEVAGYVDQKQEFEAQADLINSEFEWSRDVQARKDADAQAGKFGDGYKESVEKDFDEWANKKIENAPAGSAYQRTALGIQKLRGSILDDADKYVAQQTGVKFQTTTKDSQNKLLNEVTNNPYYADLAIQKNSELIDLAPSVVNAETRNKLKDEFRFQAYDTSLESSAKSLLTKQRPSIGEINALLKEMEKPENKWVKNTTNPTFERVKFMLRNGLETVRSRNEEEFIDGFTEAMRQDKEEGTKNYEKFNEGYIRSQISNPRKADKYIEAMNISKNVSLANNKLDLMDNPTALAEARRLDEEAKKTPYGEYNETKASAEAMRIALTNRTKALEEDASGYFIKKNPAAAELFTAISAAQTPESKRMAADNYSKFMLAEQQRITKSNNVSLMPKQMVAQYADMFAGMSKDPEGATKIAKVLGDLQLTWGNNFPVVMEDMRKAKAISPAQVVVANLMTDPANRKIAEKILMSSSQKPEDLKKISGYDEKKVNAIEAKIRGSADFQKFSASLNGSFNGADIANDYLAAMTQAALYEKVNGGSKSEYQIAHEVLGNNYSYGDGYRIPKRTMDGRSIDTDAVFVGAAKASSEQYLAQYDLVADPALGLRKEDAQEQMLSVIKSNSKWVNDSDAGLRLVSKTQDGGYSQVYRNESGSRAPIKLSWDELTGVGMALSLPQVKKEKEYKKPKWLEQNEKSKPLELWK